MCGYPKWTFNRVKQAKTTKQQQPTKEMPGKVEKVKGKLVIPYMCGLTEKLQRIYKKH